MTQDNDSWEGAYLSATQRAGGGRHFAPEPYSSQKLAPASATYDPVPLPTVAPTNNASASSTTERSFASSYDQNPVPGVHLADPLSLPYTLDPDADEEPEKEPPKKVPSVVRTIVEFALALVVALVLTWAIKSYLIEPFEVPTGSMETTIRIGDKLLADKFTINFNPVVRGDIVVFADKVQPGRILVKRVVATGGQVVDIKNGIVYVDGSPLFEPYTNGVPTVPLTQHFDNMTIEYPYTVPEGELWVMGDNRENSADSRYFGTIAVGSVYGRALMVFWPFEDIGPL